MKIALELQPMLKDKSGIGWYTYKLIENLIEENIDKDFYGVGFDFLGKNNSDAEVKKMNLKNYELNNLLPYSLYRRIYDYLPLSYNNLFKENCQVYHFFNYIVPPKVNGIVVNTVYDMTHKKFPETMNNATYERLNKELERSVNRADKIVTISNSSKNDILREFDYINENNVVIIPPGVEKEIFDININGSQNLSIVNKYKLPNKYFLYLGNIEPRKNITTIIKAFSDFKKRYNDSYKLVIAGKLSWKFEEIKTLVDDLNLNNDIIFTGYVPEQDKPYIYKNAAIFLYPSLYEGFGMPVLEAMASGIPVITSNTSSLPEVAGKGAILVSPTDYTDISNNINKILTDEVLKNNLIKEGYNQCNKYTWKESAKKLLLLYETIRNQN